MLSYFRTRYKLKGVYFLDEPETALSPKSQLELMEIIEEGSQTRQAQFIMVTHSPILLACKGATIYNFNKIPVDKTEYEETEHYQVYKKFLMER
jgi:predicted ATPase